jgi:glutamine synthetase
VHPSAERTTEGTPVRSIRVVYPDLHGVARGKEVPIAEFDDVIERGLCFCAAVMGTDLRNTPVVGREEGYPDLIARPDMSTMTTLPWEPGVASCLANLEPAPGGAPFPDPRGALRRAVEDLRAIGLDPVVAPELEFFLLERDPAATHGIRRHLDRPSMVYTVGPQADPDGVVRTIAQGLEQLGLEVLAFNHEFMKGQYEVNLRHTEALRAADRAFRLKAAVKDIAAQHGLVATFMGRPFNDQGGSGAHFHVSLVQDGRNAFDASEEEHGVGADLRAFTAGVLAHAPGLMALLCPTVNAYRRIQPDSLAPTHVNWGWDNRTTFVRIPPERGGATRIEIRAADGAANPYLAIAAVLAAGAHGVREGLTPPRPVDGDAYRADRDLIGPALPTSLDAALDALEGDTVLRRALSPQLVETFLAVKRFEVERHRAWVSDWEIDEYLPHL